jgi:TolB protein
MVRLDGDGERSLGKGRLPAWSPDGRWIAFETLDNKGNEQIWWMDANGGKREQLTWDDYPNRGPNWSPDGRSLIMMSKIGGNWQIVIFDLNSRGKTQITSGSVDKRFPVWSPDGEWITFNTLKSGSPDQIWIIKADGSQEVKLTDSGQNGRPTWSPDGSFLLFNAWVGDTWKIVRIALDGSGYQIISHGGGGSGDGQPDWTW